MTNYLVAIWTMLEQYNSFMRDCDNHEVILSIRPVCGKYSLQLIDMSDGELILSENDLNFVNCCMKFMKSLGKVLKSDHNYQEYLLDENKVI